MVSEKGVLSIADYAILSLMLIASSAIGVYFKFAGGKKKTTEEFLLAGKDMDILPVAVSVMATYTSAVGLIGTAAEVYMYGTNVTFFNVGYGLGALVSAYFSLPVFFNINASGAYEYLERRFGRTLRTLCSCVFAVQTALYMAVVIYAPSLALSAVTNLSTWVSVAFIGVVCTFYCTLGGMKAILWTDVFQAVMMYICVFTVIIKGCLDAGGIEEVVRIASDPNRTRLIVPSFSADLTSRYTMWNILSFGLIYSMAAFGGNQMQVQRLLSVKNIRRSRRVLLFGMSMVIFFSLLCTLAGVVIYSHFADCDPMTSPSRPISSADQLLPYYVMTTLKHYPGLPGLCVAGIFSACLSSFSSGVNSLAVVTMQDLVRPFCAKGGSSKLTSTFSAKVITFFFGFLCVSLAFFASLFGNLVQTVVTVLGMFSGPVIGVFLLGMVATRSNEKGATLGLLASVAISATMGFGSVAHGPRAQKLPTSTEACPALNASMDDLLLGSSLLLGNVTSVDGQGMISAISTDSSKLKDPPAKDVSSFYKLSYLWLGPVGFVSSVIIGYTASIVINIYTGYTKEVPSEYISPIVKWLFNMEDTKLEKINIAIVSMKVISDRS